MRKIGLWVFTLVLVAPSAFAGIAQEDMSRVISKLDLGRMRTEAHAQCIQDVPAAAEWLRDPVIDQYCVVRHGAPRKVGVFVGVRLSAELGEDGKAPQAAIIEQLVDVQGALGEAGAP